MELPPDQSVVHERAEVFILRTAALWDLLLALATPRWPESAADPRARFL
jgi:hypothetical protein